jgi:hypothetical protein
MTAAPRVVVRRDAERGHLRNAWLEARLSFSFGDWHSPGWSRFGRLLALNEDRSSRCVGSTCIPMSTWTS